MKSHEYWSAEALKSISKKRRTKQRTIGEQCFFMERCIAVGHLSRLNTNSKGKVLILKTDLWNEGINNAYGDVYTLNTKFHDGMAKVVGIDISKNVCVSAKQEYPNINAICADVQKLPFKASSFDVIMDISTIDHIPGRASDIIQEYGRVLKKDGAILIIFDTKSLLWKLIPMFCIMFYRNAEFMKWRLNECWYLISHGIIKESLRKNDFKVLHDYPLGLFPLFILVLEKIGIAETLGGLLIRITEKLIETFEQDKLSKLLYPLSMHGAIIAVKEE